MPRMPKRPCSYPGCPELTDGRFCEKHRKLDAQQYNRYERDPEINKRYDRRWAAVRAAYVKEHPLCEECLKEGRVTLVEQVHHIKPLAQGGTHDWENLMSLCKACHARMEMSIGGQLNKREG